MIFQLGKDRCLEKEPVPVHSFVREMKESPRAANEAAHENLGISQDMMKEIYDHDTVARSFKVGGQVLVLISSSDNPLYTTFAGL